MTWSRFDDAARTHPKARSAGNEAWGFWCASIMYSNQYGTDGFIPFAALTDVMPEPITRAKAKRLAEILCSATVALGERGLFVRDDERGGYLVNDFLDWNPSKAELDARRKKDRDRKKTADSDGRSSGTPHGIPSGTPRGIPNGKELVPDGIPGGIPDGIPDGFRDSRPRARPRMSAGARVPSPPGPPVHAQPARSDPERTPDPELQATPCPADLVARATKVGLVASLAKRFGASESDVVAVADEFVEFWVVQRGGQAQKNWMGKLRARVEAKHRSGDLVGASGPPPDGVSPAAAAERDKRLELERRRTEEHQRKLIAEHEASVNGASPSGVRNVRALTAVIGNGGKGSNGSSGG